MSSAAISVCSNSLLPQICKRRSIRRLQPADFIHHITAYVLRVLPVETIETTRDDVFRRLVERLRDRVVALVRPVGREDLVGPASQKHVELTGDSLANGLAQGVVQEGHGPASVGEPVPRILLGTTGRLHDAVQRDLGNGDDLSHCLSPVSSLRIPEDEHLTASISGCRFAISLSGPLTADHPLDASSQRPSLEGSYLR